MHGVDSQGTPYTSWRNHCSGVAAPSIDEAIGKVRSENPEAVVLSANHRGGIDFECYPVANFIE